MFRSVGGRGGGALAIKPPTCLATQPPREPPSHPATQPPSHLATILCWGLHFACSGAYPATAGGGEGGGLGPCRATVPPHRVCRVTRGRRCVVSCEGDRHLCRLCRLCRPCRHDTEGGGGGDHWKVCRGTCRDIGKLLSRSHDNDDVSNTKKFFNRKLFVQHNNFVLKHFFQHNNFCVQKFCVEKFCVEKFCVEVCHIVCL